MKLLYSIAFFFLFAATGQLNAQELTTIKRDSFSLKYPSAWTVDTKDEDYDPDALFSLDAPDGDNMIMFMIFNVELDAEELMNEQVKAMSEQVVKNPQVTSFTQWGNYKGMGKKLSGKLLGVFKGFVRIFVYSDGHKTMLVVEQCYDKAFETLKKDYEVIESSFRFL
jgi:hypothetical protein